MKVASLLLLFFLNCFVEARSPKQIWVRQRPLWAVVSPSDSTTIYGVGTAPLAENIVFARNRAKQEALAMLSDNMVHIVNETAASLSKNRESVKVASTLYPQKIDSFVSSALSTWNVVSSVACKKDDSYYVLVSFDKNLFRGKIFQHLDSVVKVSVKALEESYPHKEDSVVTFSSLIASLEEAFETLHDCWGIPMGAMVGGRKVMLDKEFERRTNELLSQITLTPSHYGVINVKSGVLPDSLGVSITIEGKPVQDINVIWHSDEKLSFSQSIPGSFVSLPLKGLVSKYGSVSIKALPDLRRVREKFLLKGLVLEELVPVSFKFVPEKISVNIVKGVETRAFVRWLVTHNRAILKNSEESLGLFLAIGFEEPIKAGEYIILKGSARLELRSESKVVLIVHGEGRGKSIDEATAACRSQIYRRLIEKM